MTVLTIAIISLILDALACFSILSWFSIIGFVFGVTAWVIARKMRMTGTGSKFAAPGMALGIVGTFAGVVGILFSFVLGNILVSGFVIFYSRPVVTSTRASWQIRD